LIVHDKEKALSMIYHNNFSSADPTNISKYIFMVKFFSRRLRDDYEVMNEAICNEPYNIIFASSRLRSCKDLALLAVMQSGFCLEYVGRKLKNNKEVVKVAIKQYPWVLKYASLRLQNDPSINFHAKRYLKN